MKQVGKLKTGRMRKLKTSSENQGIRKKKPVTRSRSNFVVGLKFKMITNLLPLEATHITFDLFEKQPLLITSNHAFTQKVCPSFSPDDPMLEFEVLGDRHNFIDLQKLLLEIKCKRSRNSDGDLRTGTGAANTDAPYLSNNTLHHYFSECTVSANGVKISNTNGNYAHKEFNETEFSSGENARKHMAILSGILLRGRAS